MLRRVPRLLKQSKLTYVYDSVCSLGSWKQLEQVRHHNQDMVLQELCRKGHLDQALDVLSSMLSSPSDDTYLFLLKSCHENKSLLQAKKVQDHLTLHRNRVDGFLGSYLVLTLAKCGGVKDAHRISDGLPRRSVFTWTALISAYAECGLGQKALSLYQDMLEDKVEPNSYTFVSLLKACGSIPDLVQGKMFHALANRKGFVSGNVHVGTAILSMYERCGAVSEAEDLFLNLGERNVVSWNVMLSLYVQQGQGEKALKVYRQMQEDGVTPDQQTLLFAIRACGDLASEEDAHGGSNEHMKAISLHIGRALHGLARLKKLSSDAFISSALLKLYGRCSAIVEAENIFHTLPQRDIVSLTTMLTTYVGHGHGKKALELYSVMQAEHVTIDDAVLVCILQACNNRGSLDMCKKLHFDVVTGGCDDNPSIIATLIHSYGNCTSIQDARSLFNKHSDTDIVVWNACIAGYAREGNTEACLELFEKLKKSHMKPNDVTFISVLSACNNSGLVTKGLEYFKSMKKDYGLTPSIKHYGIVIDLLGRQGEFKRLHTVLDTMPMVADLTVWLSLLGACGSHGNVELARRAFDHSVKLQPKHGGAYALMKKIYVNAGMDESAAEIDKIRQLSSEL